MEQGGLVIDSTVLDVAIGLVLVFFLLALASSSVVEAIAGIFKVRANMLEQGITALVDNPSIIYKTSVFGALSAASGSTNRGKDKVRKPSYVSARAFADAVVESVSAIKSTVDNADDLAGELPENLRKRLDAITNEVGTDVTAIKARLEQWFDDSMDRVSGAFKRWSQIALVLIALALTIATNASATRVAATLWNQPTVREAAVQAAKNVSSDKNAAKPTDIKGTVAAVKSLESLGLPVGWKHWDSEAGPVGTIFGWLITALLVMLGAPFWYGLLTKLVSLRSSGPPPARASNDPASATSTETDTSAAGTTRSYTPATLSSALASDAFPPLSPPPSS
jgi:hypothetical protein